MPICGPQQGNERATSLNKERTQYASLEFSKVPSNPELASRPFYLRAEGRTNSSAKMMEMQVQLL